MTAASLEKIYETLADGDLVAARHMIGQVRAGLSPDDPPALRATAARAAAAAAPLSGDPRSALPLVNEALDLAAAPENHDPAVAIHAELELADVLTALGDVERAQSALARADRLAARTTVSQTLHWKVGVRRAALELHQDPQRAVRRLESLAAQVPRVSREVAGTLPPALRHLLAALEGLAAHSPPSEIIATLRAAAAEARRAEDLPSYVAAHLALSQVLDGCGDRVGAYRSLATGWATLNAAFDGDTANRCFLPAIRELRGKWGSAAFDSVKSAVEAEAVGNSG